jgi:hypothetical protein
MDVQKKKYIGVLFGWKAEIEVVNKRKKNTNFYQTCQKCLSIEEEFLI